MDKLLKLIEEAYTTGYRDGYEFGSGEEIQKWQLKSIKDSAKKVTEKMKKLNPSLFE